MTKVFTSLKNKNENETAEVKESYAAGHHETPSTATDHL